MKIKIKIQINDYHLFNVCHPCSTLNEEDFQKEINYIYSMGKLNGYKKDVLRRIQLKHEKRRDLGRITTLVREKKRRRENTTPQTRMIGLSFNPPLTDKIQKNCKKT
jgi:hypothetical protein